jgi:hypothetical protein
MFLSFDPGFGSVKLYGQSGGLSLQSVVATAKGTSISPMTGLKAAYRPLCVEAKSVLDPKNWTGF